MIDQDRDYQGKQDWGESDVEIFGKATARTFGMAAKQKNDGLM